MTRTAYRRDSNHAEIADALRAIGVHVVDLAAYGMSIDLMTFWRGEIRLLEIKDGSKSPSRRKLTVDELRLHKDALRHGVTIHVVESVDAALALHGARRGA